MTTRATRSFFAAAAFVLLAACAGKPPVKATDSNAPCPIVSGTYCATGSISEKGFMSQASDRPYLPHYLGFRYMPEWESVDTVEIDGVSDGSLRLILRSGEDEFARTEVPRSELLCDADRFAMKMDTVPWGGAGPILALGASAGWRTIQRDTDGVLHIDQKRRETGTLMLVIPFIARSKTSMQFQPVHEGGCPPPM